MCIILKQFNGLIEFSFILGNPVTKNADKSTFKGFKCLFTVFLHRNLLENLTTPGRVIPYHSPLALHKLYLSPRVGVSSYTLCWPSFSAPPLTSPFM